MPEKPYLDFEWIAQRLRAFELPEVDCVVGILTGGRAPAVMTAYKLAKPLYLLPLNYRGPDNEPRHKQPVLTAPTLRLPPEGAKVLLVDDVSVSGSTMEKAKELLSGRKVTTFAFKGQGADLILLDEIRGCVQWPWNDL